VEEDGAVDLHVPELHLPTVGLGLSASGLPAEEGLKGSGERRHDFSYISTRWTCHPRP